MYWHFISIDGHVSSGELSLKWMKFCRSLFKVFCQLLFNSFDKAKNSLQKVSSPFVGECQLCILWWRSVGPDLAIFHHFRKKRFKLSVNFECFWRAWENIEPPLFAIGHIFIAVIGPILKNNLSIGRSHWWRWRRSLHRRKLQNSLL